MTEPVVLHDLLNDGWKLYPFEPFREGVEICKLYEGEVTLALLRYQPGASVPSHLHAGMESIFVLQGSQRDERGEYHSGCCVLNPTGYQHSVSSDQGCVVLVQWVRPVEFVDPDP